MQIKIPHRFTKDEAIARVKQSLDEARPSLVGQATIAKEKWQDNTLAFDLTVQGQQITGTLTVLEHEFDLYAKLPLMMRMFEGRIQKAIEEQTKAALG